MRPYKYINTNTLPTCYERANPSNISVGDIVHYKNRQSENNYCRIDKISENYLYVTEVYYRVIPSSGYNVFMIDENYNKNNYSHKGTLNYNYNIPNRNARVIMIVDRPQLCTHLN